MGKKEKTHQAEKIKEKLSLLERSTARETEQRLQNALFLCLFFFTLNTIRLRECVY